jgi:hypothetical protein
MTDDPLTTRGPSVWPREQDDAGDDRDRRREESCQKERSEDLFDHGSPSGQLRGNLRAAVVHVFAIRFRSLP